MINSLGSVIIAVDGLPAAAVDDPHQRVHQERPLLAQEAAWVDGCDRFTAFRIVAVFCPRPG